MLKNIPIESKKCYDCGLRINFNHFKAMHPALSIEDAKELFNNPLVVVYCPNCFFHRPERPYRKRGSFYYKYTIPS
jgi:uncharacterized protein YlaI